MSAAEVPKKSAFSCEPCRKRKVKCPGEKPECSRCLSRHDQCVYKLNPTLSYTQRLETRVKELEEQLAALRGSSPQAEPIYVKSEEEASSSSAPDTVPQPQETESAIEDHLVGNFRGLEVDEKGVITYHGATSFFQLPKDNISGPGSQDGLGHTSPQSNPEEPEEARRERLVSNAWQQRVLEDLSATPEPFQYLLNTHWCWIQPMFNFIYRPAFTRDMQVMGPYYSHTLMNAVLSHSIRWGKSDPATREKLDQGYEGGVVFGRHARSMAFDDLSRGICTVPTAQTFLLLSAQECSLGNSAQAYVYSGIAFRMIDHLGIFVDGQKYAGVVNLSDEDIEIRNRLFWSCYFWDKMISLYLGRSPSLQHSTVSPPQIMLDDSAEEELWVPFGLDVEGVQYPPTPAHSTSAFMRMCQLSVIFNQILIHMYDPLRQNTASEMQECLARQETALREWWDDLPVPLKIDASNLPPLAPPSHIVTLNSLYNTFKILLYRPMLSRRSTSTNGSSHPNPNHLLECVASATSIIAMFDLFCRTFGDLRCVLSLSYSVYIAASIFLLQVQANANDNIALRRLEFCIQALGRVKAINPVINTPLNSITRELAALGISSPFVNTPTTATQSAFSPTEANGPVSPMYSRPARHIPQLSQSLQYVQGHLPSSVYGTQPPPQGYEITPELFEAVSSLEPLSIQIGALQESGTYFEQNP